MYRSEWESGSQKQMQVVVEAITQSGLGNFSQMLRDTNARVVAHLVENSNKKVNYLETGAGVSTINVYQEMQRKNIDLEKMFSVLVEPSRDRIEATAENLKKMGLKDKNFKIFIGKDTDILNFVDKKSQDIISTVATIHHHSYMDQALGTLYEALNDNGLVLIADWHNSMWEHPSRVYESLQEDYDWPSKDEDLKAFVKAYPKALISTQKMADPANDEANRMIRKFWQSYGKIRAKKIANGPILRK